MVVVDLLNEEDMQYNLPSVDDDDDDDQMTNPLSEVDDRRISLNFVPYDTNCIITDNIAYFDYYRCSN